MTRGFRWLLLAYPPGPRRTELLDTLVEIAEETGQRRPTARQVVDLLHCGMRARLGHPRSTGIVVVAALFTVVGALFGAAAAAPAGWALAPALPQGAAAEALKQEIFPGRTSYGGGDAPAWVPTGDGESQQFGYSLYWTPHTEDTRDPLAFATALRDRLAAGGWTARGDIVVEHEGPDELPPAWDSASFQMTRDGLTLRFADTVVEKLAPWDSDGSVTFTVSRRPPAVLWAAVVVGGLAGALAAWLFAGWVARRVEGRPVRTAAAFITTGFGLFFLLPVTAYAWLWAINNDGDPSAAETWFTGLRLFLSGGQIFVVVPVLVLAAIAVFPRRPRLPRFRPAAAFGASVLAFLAVAYAGSLPAAARDTFTAADSGAPCVPAVPAADDPDSSRAFVFIDRDTPAEQRNLIQAAISRTPGVFGYIFVGEDLRSQTYRDAFCGGRPLPDGTGADLPYFWEVDLANPGGGHAAGLAAVVAGMPGLVAVRAA